MKEQQDKYTVPFTFENARNLDSTRDSRQFDIGHLNVKIYKKTKRQTSKEEKAKTYQNILIVATATPLYLILLVNKKDIFILQTK